ncbi:amidase [Litorimonas cladophorae]|uniref:Amidase n=1 Tax=Litorimonas cladophorae TaxID=1220491 RepID=A0A918KJW6_9PROT|nr:amidase [Litorimonas cladophorae]GGX63995.1 amidase [Litorimonas cladophorae]
MRLFLISSASLLLSACVTVKPYGPMPSDYRKMAQSDYVATGWAEKSLPEISEGLAAKRVTSQALTQTYLRRISNIDQDGPTLRSVLALNPDALAQAKASDARRAAGQSLGPMDGIPVLLKDNIETLDPVATTAGAYALAGNVTGRDSPLVAGLRAQGAVILGKTNLSQWANFRSNESVSGWTALGGQVRNPHMLDRSPCGSSSGSGVAAAASLAAGTVGTETNGSIICPSNVNGIVGFKPTVGLVSQKHIVPISASQDTAGPMTKTVRGAALMLDAMDNQNVDYAAGLAANSLRGARVGVMRFAEGSNDDIKDRFNASLVAMAAAGAVLVEIEDFSPDVEAYGEKALDVLLYEFKAGINEYLAEAAPAVKTRSLQQLIAYNENEPREIAIFDQDLFEAAQEKGDLTEADYLAARTDIQRATGSSGIDRLMKENQLDILVSPSGPVSSRVDPINGDVWPSWAGAGYLAAVAGYPHITVPMGDIHGVPIGFSIMAGKGQDAEVLSYGYAFEQVAGKRVAPKYLRDAGDRPELAVAMRINQASLR